MRSIQNTSVSLHGTNMPAFDALVMGQMKVGAGNKMVNRNSNQKIG